MKVWEKRRVLETVLGVVNAVDHRGVEDFSWQRNNRQLNISVKQSVIK
jgi:hypothetical protein